MYRIIATNCNLVQMVDHQSFGKIDNKVANSQQYGCSIPARVQNTKSDIQR